MSFDLVVWALEHGASSAEVRAAHARCRQGQHARGAPQPRVAAFYRAVIARHPDGVAAPASPWEVVPLHIAADHVEMRLSPSCDDEVLLLIERLAGEHGLLLFDPQDGSVYPPPRTVVR
ncbi:hypothetical protein ACIBF5_16450 [Micromonospora sp. NPDC050417]|uniref:hypothetical protein n=1 Tax=Micromonospora sp. NPDC050417 TaxID=3364280 RepID=UPI0037ABF0BE